MNGQIEGRHFRAHLRELAPKGVDELDAFAAVEPVLLLLLLLFFFKKKAHFLKK